MITAICIPKGKHLYPLENWEMYLVLSPESGELRILLPIRKGAGHGGATAPQDSGKEERVQGKAETNLGLTFFMPLTHR